MGEIDSSSKHWTEMSLYKWCWICFFGGLITVIGLPTAVKAEVSTEETRPTTVKECRIHIEKALEQYWDEKTDGDNLDETHDTNYINENLNERTERILTTRETNLELGEVGETDRAKDLNQEVSNAEKVDDSTNESADEDIDDNDDDDDDDDDDGEDASDGVNGDGVDNAGEDTDKDDEDTDENGDDDEEDDDETTDESNENVVEAEEEDEDDDGDDDVNDDVQDRDVGDKVKEETNEHVTVEFKTDGQQYDASVQEVSGISENEIQNEKHVRVDDNIDNQSDVNEDDSEDDDESDDTEPAMHTESFEKEKTTDGSEIKADDTKEEKTSVDHNEKVETITIGEKTIESITTEEKVIKVTSEESQMEKPEYLKEEKEKSEDKSKKIDASSEEIHPEIDTKNSEQIKDIPEERQQDRIQAVGSTTGEEEDSIENIYEDEEEQERTLGLTFRSRDHVDAILGLDEIETPYEKEEEELAQTIFKEIKKIETINIKPMELLYKYADSTTRVLGDAEIFNKPMLLFLGPWSAGKTSIINYILGLERTDAALTTGTGITDVDFTLLTYGNTRRLVSGTELAADWRYSGVQKFGQAFLDHFRSIHIPHTLLKQVTIVDTPGILENRKNAERGYSLNDAFQWFIDRADAIYIVLDPTKVDIGSELAAVVDQLKGRDVRFILNKADMIRRSDLMRIVGQLFWNLSPLMSSTEAPVIYAVSLTTHPYHPSAPVNFLADQEKNLFYDMKTTLDKRVENKILYARKHAVRVRNHAKMVDCYLATYYRHKSIFSNKRNIAKLITENPRDYNIYDGLSSMTNISRYDIPNPLTYREFFKMHPLYDFKPLASTCSYFRGCPMDKLDLAITKDIPELLAKYKKEKSSFSEKLNR